MAKRVRTVRITRSEVQSILNKIPFTAFFGATFVKANGEIRKMNCNRSISKGIANQRKQNAIDSRVFVVYDVNAPGYRYVNPKTITEIRANGKKYVVVG
jgi:hypothetical protein